MKMLNGYDIIEKLHTGESFDIYRGQRLDDNKKVILKAINGDQLSSNNIASLQHEYSLLKQLNLAGVIKANNFIKNENSFILELEDFPSQTLEHYLNNLPLTLDAFFIIAIQIVDILGTLHQQKIIHKDLNPANILIDINTQTIKLINLNISSQLSEETQEYVNPYVLEGTLAYVSPEQTGRMNRNIDYRTDFYSLGVTFYQMLAGCPPFVTDDPLEMVHCHIAKMPPDIRLYNSTVPEAVAAIINKLLAKMPEDRYSSIYGIKEDLKICYAQWQQNGTIQSFELGKHDVNDHLHISQKLYGREEQVDTLIKTFNEVLAGNTSLLLVSGYSGVGKTSLIKELYKLNIQQACYFISGKFDQLRVNTPYSAILNAFQTLINQLLVEPEKKLNKIRNELHLALGHLGGVVTEVIPELSLIIGEQPPVPALPPTESQNRFNLVFLNFIRVFTNPEHPLILFIDDLQWIDNASLKLLTILLSDIDIKYLMVIGAYRDNEVNQDHPLQLALNEMSNVNIQNIVLQPLTKANINALLMDTFSCSEAKVEMLSELLLEKTQGNPFFINEFIKDLYLNKQINFSYERGCWDWDIASIQQQEITDNIIDLLVVKIHKLSIPTQSILKLAACVGYVFDLVTIATISQQSLSDTAELLWGAVQANLIKPLGKAYKSITDKDIETGNFKIIANKIKYVFIHDRVQQAVYQLIPEHIKEELHLKIGRLLIADKKPNQNDERLFEIMGHFARSLSLITDEQEKNELAEYFLWVACKAKSVIAYNSAKQYLTAAITLLNSESWSNNYDLTYSLYRELCELSYLLGEISEADNYFELLLTKVNTDLAKAEIYGIKITQYNILARYSDAILLGLKILGEMGVNIPNKIKPYHVISNILSLKLSLVFKDMSKTRLQRMTDEKQIAIVNLITKLVNSAYFSNPDLLIILTCKSLQLNLKYGYTKLTGLMAMIYALLCVCFLKDYKTGFKFVAISEKYMEIANYPLNNALARVVYGNLIKHWRDSAYYSLNYTMDNYQYCLQAGNLNFAGYSINHAVFLKFFIGKPLDEVLAMIETYLAFSIKVNSLESRALFLSMQKYVKLLQGTEEVHLDSLFKLENEFMQSEHKTAIVQAYGQYCKTCYILELYDLALATGKKYESYRDFTRGLITAPEGELFYGLSICALYPDMSKQEKKLSLIKLKNIIKLLKFWVKEAPVNFLDLYLLMLAEYERIRENHSRAELLYNQAIKAAKENQHIHIEAIINECTASYYLSLNKDACAYGYMVAAYQNYQSWGCKGKLKLLLRKYPKWFELYEQSASNKLADNKPAAVADNKMSLDLYSVLKSAQVLSSEIHLDKLLQSLLKVMLENAGAQRGVLIAKYNDNFIVKAESNLENERIYLTEYILIEYKADLPLTLINYVQRTCEPVVIDESTNNKLTLSDKYINHAKPKSILVMPILYQSQLRYILYLENNSITGAFTQKHLNILQLLAAQAAISLENASLYYQATHDPLTGLANRNLLYQTFNYLVNQRQKPDLVAVVFLDLDNFKTINDTLGHDVGDKLLLLLADKLRQSLREGDIAARLGGDEFVLMLTGIDDVDDVHSILSRLYEEFAQPVTIFQHELLISLSTGVSFYPEDGLDMPVLLKKADIALYQAKKKGKSCFEFYSNN